MPRVVQRRNGAHLHDTAMKKIFLGPNPGVTEVDVDIFFGVKRLQNGAFLFHMEGRQRTEGAEETVFVFFF